MTSRESEWPEPSTTVEPAADVDRQLARTIGELAGEKPEPRRVRRFVDLAARSARRAGVVAVASGRWFAEITLESAGHLPVRDLETMRLHHRGKDGQELAAALVRRASLSSAAVGAATGALATASQATPATWTTLPFELLAETLLVVGIEMKLVAELHAVAGRPIGGNIGERGAAIARAWSESRGIRPGELLAGGKLDVVGRQARNQLTAVLRRRLVARTGRNLGSFVPFLAGAVAGGALNRRATAKLGRKVAASLGVALP
ncbi:MAG: hypothetical protein ACRD29_04075 [Acidimicrobiales bacterium]